MAEDNDNRGDATEEASPRKREDARKQGQFAQSHDLLSALQLCAGLLALSSLGTWLYQSLTMMMQSLLSNLTPTHNLVETIQQSILTQIFPASLPVLLLIGSVALAGFGVGMAQAGIHFNIEMLSPKWTRVSPASGFKRIFSMQSIITTVLGIFKLVVVGWMAYSLFKGLVVQSPIWWQAPAEQLIPLIGGFAMSLGWRVAVALLILSGVDFAYRLWKHEKDLKMTKEEIKQENKQQEGDPHIKQRVRSIQRQRATRRMMKDIPKATVIITNPTHVAIALRYEPGMRAPIIVAKGEALVAQRIKAIAKEHDIPTIEEPPLARALLRTVQIGQEIPIEFYRAVAEILALLARQRQAARSYGINQGGKNSMNSANGMNGVNGGLRGRYA